MPLPTLRTNVVPDFAGAHQNALRSQGQMMQNQLMQQQMAQAPGERNYMLQQRANEQADRAYEIGRRPLKDEAEAIDILKQTAPLTTWNNYPQVREHLLSIGMNPEILRTPEQYAQEAIQKGLTPDIYFKQQMDEYIGRDQTEKEAAPTELTKLISARDQLPEGDPRRKFYEDRINKISTDSGDKAPALSQIGKLMAERDALPPGDPGRKSYNDRIKKLTSEKPDVQTDIKGERALAKEFTAHPEVSSFMKIEEQYQRATVAIGEAREASGSMNAVDQSLIQLLNRILDPGSVVRESEYARTPEGMAVIDRMQGYYGKLTAGGAGLSKDEREALYTMIDKFYAVAQESFNEQVDYYTDLSNRYGIPPENIIRLGGTKAGGKYTRINTAGGYLDKFKDK